MFACGKHGQQAIVATENFFDGTLLTLACGCRGTADALGQPPDPVAEAAAGPSHLQEELDELDELLSPAPEPEAPEPTAMPPFAERMKAAKAKKAATSG